MQKLSDIEIMDLELQELEKSKNDEFIMINKSDLDKVIRTLWGLFNWYFGITFLNHRSFEITFEKVLRKKEVIRDFLEKYNINICVDIFTIYREEMKEFNSVIRNKKIFCCRNCEKRYSYSEILSLKCKILCDDNT